MLLIRAVCQRHRPGDRIHLVDVEESHDSSRAEEPLARAPRGLPRVIRSPGPSAGQHNSAALDLLQARAGLPEWTIRVHHIEHSPIIDLPQPPRKHASKKPGHSTGFCAELDSVLEISEMLKERLRSKHQTLTGDQVVALHMDLLGESLIRQDAHAWANFIIPAMDHRTILAGVLIKLFKG